MRNPLGNRIMRAFVWTSVKNRRGGTRTLDPGIMRAVPRPENGQTDPDAEAWRGVARNQKAPLLVPLVVPVRAVRSSVTVRQPPRLTAGSSLAVPTVMPRTGQQRPIEYRDQKDRVWSVSEVAVLKVVSPAIAERHQ